MSTFEEIVERYDEFNSFLQSINVEDLRNQYTRQELNELASKISNLNLRSLSYDIRKLTDEMKKQEYPELLGVHHFPVLRSIDFLTEEQKKELDKFLVKFRVGEYVSNLWRITKDQRKADKLLDFLLQSGVVDERYFGLCPNCHDGFVTGRLDSEQKKRIDYALSLNHDSNERYEILLALVDCVCQECDYEPDLDESGEMHYKTVFRMAMGRDKRLDNI